ncbi:MAG: hypothetical protein IKQ23_05660 [Treponema sp.]|jgi:hypothetical protein|nr:hypothetical protein [Treponema sp.]
MKIKAIIILGLCMIFNYAAIAQNNEKISEIIFWAPNKELNLDILNSKSLLDLLNRYEVHTILDLRIFTGYDKESHSLYFYTHSDNLDYSDDDIVFDPGYNFSKNYYSIFKKIAYQNSFFSVVVNGKIVMNGLNRVYHDLPIKFEHDDDDIPKIHYELDYSFRICYKFYCPFKDYTKEDIKKEKVLYIKELDDYYKNKNK